MLALPPVYNPLLFCVFIISNEWIHTLLHKYRKNVSFFVGVNACTVHNWFGYICSGYICKIFGWILFILFQYVYVLFYLSCVCVYYMCCNLTRVWTMKYRSKTIYTHKPYKITSNSKQCLYICIWMPQTFYSIPATNTPKNLEKFTTKKLTFISNKFTTN